MNAKITSRNHLAINFCLNTSISVDWKGKRCPLLCPFDENSHSLKQIIAAENKKNCIRYPYHESPRLGQVLPATGRDGAKGEA